MSLNLIVDFFQLGEAFIQEMKFNESHASLIRTNSNEEISASTPYLFDLEKIEFQKWVTDNLWGNANGIFIFSESSFDELYKHFRRFLMIKDEDDKKMYFHYYIPAVLRIFLPSCDKQQLKEFFGPVEQFICEDEDVDYGLVFSLKNDILMTDRILKEEIFDLKIFG